MNLICNKKINKIISSSNKVTLINNSSRKITNNNFFLHSKLCNSKIYKLKSHRRKRRRRRKEVSLQEFQRKNSRINNNKSKCLKSKCNNNSNSVIIQWHSVKIYYLAYYKIIHNCNSKYMDKTIKTNNFNILKIICNKEDITNNNNNNNKDKVNLIICRITIFNKEIKKASDFIATYQYLVFIQLNEFVIIFKYL